MSDNNNRILYIDDNKDHLMIVEAMLKREGYDCDTYSSPEKGLDAALNKVYALILVDMQMPKMSGIDILNQLKQRREELGFSVIAITADSTVFSRQNPYALGFDAHLSKPIMPMDLSQTVKRMLTASTK